MANEAPTPAQNTNTAGDGTATTPPAEAAPAATTPATPPAAAEAGKEGAESANPTSTTTEAAPSAESQSPEDYSLAAPEGSLMSSEDVEKISSIAKEKGLSAEQAKAWVDHDNALLETFVQRQSDELKARSETWVEEVRKDKEIGGERFTETIEAAKRLIDRYATPDFKTVLDNTGLGNHPELMRLFARIGKQMTEDKLVLPGAGSAGKKTPAEILYGSEKQ